MFEFKISILSKDECLLGLMFDQGEYNHKEKWIPFTRFRVGLLFMNLDFTYFHT